MFRPLRLSFLLPLTSLVLAFGMPLAGRIPAVAHGPDESVTIEALGTLGGPESVANGMGPQRQIVGWSATPKEKVNHAFLFADGKMQEIGGAASEDSEARAVNKSGQVVGRMGAAKLRSFAVLFAKDGYVRLGDLGGKYGDATGINDAGQVVGNSFTAGNTIRAFLWQAGKKMQDLGTLGGSNSCANAINNAGQITGWAQTSVNAHTHAFLWENGKLIDLETLGGRDSVAHAINASGDVVGDSMTKHDKQYHAFLYAKGQMVDLDTLGSERSRANAISDAGIVVGNAQFPNQKVAHAFLWYQGKMVDLNHYLPADSHWILLDATGVNDEGYICGWGLHGEDAVTFLIHIPASQLPN